MKILVTGAAGFIGSHVAERLVLAYQREQGWPACSLRLFSVYGPRERPEKLFRQLIRSILADEPFPLHQGSQNHFRSFTYVDDIVDGFVTMLENRDQAVGQIFNIGSDEEFTTGEGIRIVEELLGRPARKIVRPKRPGDQLRTRANIDKARRLLAYEPKTRLADGLSAEIEWYQRRIYGRNLDLP